MHFDVRKNLVTLMLVASAFRLCPAQDAVPVLPSLTEVNVASSLDGVMQPVLHWAPGSAKKDSTPLLVFLHSWSGNYKQDNSDWQKQAVARGWIFLHPDFRGPNNSPQACGSKFARQDILDAIDFACDEFNVDRSRIYLAGSSGGGHMAMLMAGHYPERFSAVSAWVGISDLGEWYRFHLKDGKPQRYAQMILNSLGGPPGESDERDADYRDRSPLFQLQRVGELPIELSAGIRDGHSGSVPIRHTLSAFNVIARAHGTELVSEVEIESFWKQGLLIPGLSADAKLRERDVFLRRHSGNARVTVFDGGHEGLPGPACEWLAAQQRDTLPSKP